MTSRGSVTTEAFVKWLTHFSRYKVTDSCLLVFEWATSHVDRSILGAAERPDIIIVMVYVL